MTIRRLFRPRVLLALAVVAGAIWLRCGPLPEGLLDPQTHVSTEIVDHNGESLYEALSGEGGRTQWLSADHLPENLAKATMAAEDRRFHWHPGVDPLAIGRALIHDLWARRMVEGGSTITQQTIKVLIHRDRSATGKLRELLLALRLEHRLSKREVLALYLNVAPYGNQLQGAEAASQTYFGCSAATLTPAQAAFLAGLPQRPSAFNPYRNFAGAQARQRWVLARMAEAGDLEPADLETALREELLLRKDPRTLPAPHFVERVKAAVPAGARRVETTLDRALQADLRGILEMHRKRLAEHGAHNVAVVVLDNARAEWLAWEGSGDYFDQAHGGAIDGAVAPRQPGSALKPFTYALAFESGFTPATVLPDIPSHFPTAVTGVLYSPRNYDGVFRGPMRLRAALAGSENVPAVWTLSQTGVPDLLRLLRRAGFSTLDKTADFYGFGLTMGDAEVRLDELVAAYAAFARGGLYRAPGLVRRVVRADGTDVPPAPRPVVPIVSPRSAYWIADILSDADARAFVFGSGGSLDFPFPVAVKTGTSQAYHDNWTVGFTREVTVGVWVGNFDRQQLQNSSGVMGAAPIFHDVLLSAQQRVMGRFPGPTDPGLAEPPKGLTAHSICALSGQAATDACPRVRSEWLVEGRTPVSCVWHTRDHGRSRVTWPPQYRSWARERGLVDPRATTVAANPAHRRPAHEVSTAGPLQIVNPPPGARYLQDPTLRPEFQSLPLRAVAEAAATPLTWQVDGVAVGTAVADRALDWPLRTGVHTIAVTDPFGHRDETSINVR